MPPIGASQSAREIIDRTPTHRSKGISMGQRDDKTSLPAWRISLRESGNPYAAHYHEPPEPQPRAEIDRQRLRAAQNPYALHYYLGTAQEDTSTQQSLSESVKPIAARNILSKADFDSGCRSIFRRYMPDMERTKLRSHHQDFVMASYPFADSLSGSGQSCA
jgi:hypothetical protein